MTIDVDWALHLLDDFIDVTSGTWEGDFYDEGQYFKAKGGDDEIRRQLAVIEQILNQYRPGWEIRSEPLTDHEPWWTRHRNLALEARGIFRSSPEVAANLGDRVYGPSALQLHPWVWSAATILLWQDRHFGAAVSAAAVSVNAETQNKGDAAIPAGVH
jgi:hypothetical protein